MNDRSPGYEPDGISWLPHLAIKLGKRDYYIKLRRAGFPPYSEQFFQEHEVVNLSLDLDFLENISLHGPERTFDESF